MIGKEVIDKIQSEMNKSDKLKTCAVTKLSKYLKTQTMRYVEIQKLPQHMIPETLNKLLKDKGISLYKVSKLGQHEKMMNKFDDSDEIITKVFLIKNSMPNNVLLSATKLFLMY